MKRLSLWIFYGLLAYMPLHIFLSTWIGTSFDLLEATRITKDVVLVVGFLGALIVSAKQKWFKDLMKDRLVLLIAGYSSLTLLIATLKTTDLDSEILGIVFNLRFLLFFLYATLISRLFDQQSVLRRSVSVVLGVAVAVLFFGIIQYTLLPDNALKSVGYLRSNGVLSAFYIDDKPDLERVMSTLRDPNSLGSYIIIIAALALAGFIKKPDFRKLFAGILILSWLCLVFTFSRSAWIGMFVSVIIVLAMYLKRPSWTNNTTNNTKRLALVAVVLGLVGLFALYQARNSYLAQNLIFHSDENTTLDDPNELRSQFIRESTADIASQPLGHGPGTAGLASIRNDIQGTNLNENYYLQIGYETGVMGLLLFVVILAVVAYRLFELPRSIVAVGLFASFAGLAITNLLVHIWSNEAVAYTWWGLAGLIAFGAHRNNHSKAKLR